VTDETRARFLTAIAAQLPAERIVEAHLFPAIRQGGMESGVAVLAVERTEEPSTEAPHGEPVGSPESVESGESSPEDDGVVSESAAELGAAAPATTTARRYTVFSARYRHTLKGPERGKWEVSVTEEADAPLLTIDAVVRGVQRRSGDADEIARLSGDEVRSLLVS
jgi:hypothetical protein